MADAATPVRGETPARGDMPQARAGAPVTGADPTNPSRRPRPAFSARWGMWVARHKWWVLGVWAVLLVLAGLAYPHLMRNLSAPDYSVTGSDSERVATILFTDFTTIGAEQDIIVFDSTKLKTTDKAYQDAVGRVVKAVTDHRDVVAVVSPYDPLAEGQISEDKRAAFATLGLNGTDRERADLSADLQSVVKDAVGSAPVAAYLTGYSQSANDTTEVENADVERAESIGIPIALIVLVIALAAVIAGLMPLIMALCSLTFTYGLLSLAITWRPIDSFLLSIVTMVGVGISIDYSLFILSRFREELVQAGERDDPQPVVTAVGVAMRTSGAHDTVLRLDRRHLAVLALRRPVAPLPRHGARGCADRGLHALHGLDPPAGPARGARPGRQQALAAEALAAGDGRRDGQGERLGALGAHGAAAPVAGHPRRAASRGVRHPGGHHAAGHRPRPERHLRHGHRQGRGHPGR